MPKYGVISGPYFPVFGLNTAKYRPEITPYLDTFNVVPNFRDYTENELSFLKYVLYCQLKWKLNNMTLTPDILVTGIS